MKIKSLFLFATLALLASPSFAADKIKAVTEKDTREEIAAFDYQKLFSEAETRYKAAKAWKKLKCAPVSGFYCPKKECVKRPIKSTLLLDKEEKKITRCEKDVCESFDADFDQTGVYVNVQTQGPVGTLIRILGDSRYKEITTVGLDAYIANGNCEVVVDEEKKD